MLVVAIAWMYVVLMVAVAEALSSQGTLLGALVTFVLYGLLPLSVVLYIMGTPTRRRVLAARDAPQAAQPQAPQTSAPPDGSGHAPGEAVAAERKET